MNFEIQNSNGTVFDVKVLRAQLLKLPPVWKPKSADFGQRPLSKFKNDILRA